MDTISNASFFAYYIYALSASASLEYNIGGGSNIPAYSSDADVDKA
jgi:hypothetical protein